MILLTTIILNAYVALLSFQVNGIMASDAIRIPMLAFLVAECVMVLLMYMGPKNERNAMRLPGVVACAIAFFIYMLCYLGMVRITISRFIEFVFFPLCLIITYINFIAIKDEKTFDQIVDIQFYYLLVVAAAFLVAQVLRRGEYNKNVNTVYYVIFTLPFILQNKNNTKKWIGLGIIFGCLFLSLKRTPLLAVGLTMIFYFNTRQTMKKTLSRAILVVVAVLICDAIFSTFFDIHMLDRMMTITEDGGSGRVQLAQRTIQLLKRSSFKQLVFGHNLRATASVFMYGAHNDFLEVIYRVGFIGFALFIGYFAGIFAQIRHYSAMENYKMANFLKATLILFVVVSFSSQLIFLPTYIGLSAMSISFGITYGEFMRDQPKIEEGV